MEFSPNMIWDMEDSSAVNGYFKSLSLLNGKEYISSLGRQDLVTQFFVKITFLYKLVAKKLDFVLSKWQISIWKDRATVAW